ncbi:hypothetical protein GCM10023156_44630 [Novipirellula rosea]|uniref:Uncharacterized protein n=1 Tax=Novipirellula rosea TaxID=1031540 RepID=A0ABP8N8D7_9BACT
MDSQETFVWSGHSRDDIPARTIWQKSDVFPAFQQPIYYDSNAVQAGGTLSIPPVPIFNAAMFCESVCDKRPFPPRIRYTVELQ